MKKTFVFLTVLMLMGASYLTVNNPKVSGQNLPEREFIKRSFQNEPVKIISLLAPNAKIIPGEKFRAADNWLNQAEFKIQNVSGKTILGISFMFLIRDLPGRVNSLGVPFTYGKVPEVKLPDTGDEPIKPNAVVEMKITPELFEYIRLGVEQTAKLADVRRVDMVLVGVYFSDGSCWEGGSFFDKVPAFEDESSREFPPGEFILNRFLPGTGRGRHRILRYFVTASPQACFDSFVFFAFPFEMAPPTDFEFVSIPRSRLAIVRFPPVIPPSLQAV